jgi:glycerate kinase
VSDGWTRMSSPSALACPDSLKRVLAARDAADALVEGFAAVGVACDPLPLADGGEGTEDALRARLPDDVAVVEAASVIPFDPSLLDVTAQSSRPLGEALGRVSASHLYLGLGGTANMDAGAGLLDVLDALPAPTTVLCDVRTTLYDAPRVFGPQKGASPEQVHELEASFRADERLAPFASLPGSGAAGGLGGGLESPRSSGRARPRSSISSPSILPRIRSSSPARGASTRRPPSARCRGRWRGAAPSLVCRASSSAASSMRRLRKRRRSRFPATRRGRAPTSSS